jgi:hypothetical protein
MLANPNPFRFDAQWRFNFICKIASLPQTLSIVVDGDDRVIVSKKSNGSRHALSTDMLETRGKSRFQQGAEWKA